MLIRRPRRASGACTSVPFLPLARLVTALLAALALPAAAQTDKAVEKQLAAAGKPLLQSLADELAEARGQLAEALAAFDDTVEQGGYGAGAFFLLFDDLEAFQIAVREAVDAARFAYNDAVFALVEGAGPITTGAYAGAGGPVDRFTVGLDKLLGKLYRQVGKRLAASANSVHKVAGSPFAFVLERPARRPVAFVDNAFTYELHETPMTIDVALGATIDGTGIVVAGGAGEPTAEEVDLSFTLTSNEIVSAFSTDADGGRWSGGASGTALVHRNVLVLADQGGPPEAVIVGTP